MCSLAAYMFLVDLIKIAWSKNKWEKKRYLQKLYLQLFSHEWVNGVKNLRNCVEISMLRGKWDVLIFLPVSPKRSTWKDVKIVHLRAQGDVMPSVLFLTWSCLMYSSMKETLPLHPPLAHSFPSYNMRRQKVFTAICSWSRSLTPNHTKDFARHGFRLGLWSFNHSFHF